MRTNSIFGDWLSENGSTGLNCLQKQVQQNGSAAKDFVAYDLDLNNDEAITDADKDGLRYHQGLPYDTRLLPKLKNEMVDAMGYYDLP